MYRWVMKIAIIGCVILGFVGFMVKGFVGAFLSTSGLG